MLEESCKIAIYDPKVNPKQIEKDLQFNQSETFSNNDNGEWIFANSIIDASKNSDAIIVTTEWEEFKDVEWSRVYKEMRKPAWLFDTRSIVDIEKVKASGINFWRVGGGLI